MTISLAAERVREYDRQTMSDGIEIRDTVDDGAVIVRQFEGAGNGVVATLAYTGEVMDLGVLALDAEGCDELVRALGYDVTDGEDERCACDQLLAVEAELAEREATCSQRYAEIQRLKREIAYLAGLRLLAETPT